MGAPIFVNGIWIDPDTGQVMPSPYGSGNGEFISPDPGQQAVLGGRSFNVAPNTGATSQIIKSVQANSADLEGRRTIAGYGPSGTAQPTVDRPMVDPAQPFVNPYGPDYKAPYQAATPASAPPETAPPEEDTSGGQPSGQIYRDANGRAYRVTIDPATGQTVRDYVTGSGSGGSRGLSQYQAGELDLRNREFKAQQDRLQREYDRQTLTLQQQSDIRKQELAQQASEAEKQRQSSREAQLLGLGSRPDTLLKYLYALRGQLPPQGFGNAAPSLNQAQPAATTPPATPATATAPGNTGTGLQPQDYTQETKDWMAQHPTGGKVPGAFAKGGSITLSEPSALIGLYSGRVHAVMGEQLKKGGGTVPEKATFSGKAVAAIDNEPLVDPIASDAPAPSDKIPGGGVPVAPDQSELTPTPGSFQPPEPLTGGGTSDGGLAGGGTGPVTGPGDNGETTPGTEINPGDIVDIIPSAAVDSASAEGRSGEGFPGVGGGRSQGGGAGTSVAALRMEATRSLARSGGLRAGRGQAPSLGSRYRPAAQTRSMIPSEYGVSFTGRALRDQFDPERSIAGGADAGQVRDYQGRANDLERQQQVKDQAQYTRENMPGQDREIYGSAVGGSPINSGTSGAPDPMAGNQYPNPPSLYNPGDKLQGIIGSGQYQGVPVNSGIINQATGGTSLIPSLQRYGQMSPTEQQYYGGFARDIAGIPLEDLYALTRQLGPARNGNAYGSLRRSVL